MTPSSSVKPAWSPPTPGARSVVITGKISGDVSAARRIEIRPTAQVFGNLTTPVLVVHEGALLEGHCMVNPEAKEDLKMTLLAPKEDHRGSQ